MSNRRYSEQQASEARRLNHLVEDDWKERQERGLAPSGQAEWAWRRDQQSN